MYKFATAIGVDIGRTMIRTAIVRYDGKIFESLSFPYETKPDRDLLISYITDAVNQTRGQSLKHNVNPLCIGISAKGFVDYKNGIVIGPDQGIDGWANVNLSKEIGTGSGLPVFVDNDANLMAFAENSYGIAAENRDIIFVTLRSGIGGAVIIDGKLFRGLNNAGGEIGQMILNFDGPVSENGIKGSYEHYASSFALVKHYKSLSGQADKTEVNGILGFRAKDVFELSYRGDADAIKAVNQNANFVGIGLANLISIFSPEVIVLGGGMTLARDSYIDLIRKSAFENSLDFCNKNVKILKASLGYSSSLMGAALFSLTRLDGKSI